MKALPKLMKNSALFIEIVSEEMPSFVIAIHGAKAWPSIARFDKENNTLRFFDGNGVLIHEQSFNTFFKDPLANFGLIFSGVTESRVDFATKTQNLTAKMRAINLDSHEQLHGDNWGYDE